VVFPAKFAPRLPSCPRNPKAYDPTHSSKKERVIAVEAPEIIEVDSSRVSCDGIGGALGHPRVFLEMGDGSAVKCPYCDRRFVLRDGAAGHAH